MRKKTDRKKASIKKKKLDSKRITDSEEEEKPKKQEIKYQKNWRSDDYSINSDITEDTYKKKKTPNKTQKNNKIKENNQNVGKKKTIKKYKKDSDKENKRDEKIDIEMKDETKENNNEDNPSLNNNYLPCREKEQKKIYDYIKKGLETNGNYNSLYIAGMPGTGKTACVKAVIDIIETEIKKKKKENLNFTKLFICGTEYPNISNIYKAIYNFIFSSNRNIKTKRYSQYLNKFFENRDKIKEETINQEISELQNRSLLQISLSDMKSKKENEILEKEKKLREQIKDLIEENDAKTKEIRDIDKEARAYKKSRKKEK